MTFGLILIFALLVVILFKLDSIESDINARLSSIDVTVYQIERQVRYLNQKTSYRDLYVVRLAKAKDKIQRLKREKACSGLRFNNLVAYDVLIVLYLERRK